MTDGATALADYFASQPDIELAILFGSFATPAQRSTSDVDVAVLCRDARHPDARSDLLVRYLIDAADFGHYYERTLRERRASWIG